MLVARPFHAIEAHTGLVAGRAFLAGTTIIRFTDGDDEPCAVRETVDDIANLLDARRAS